MLTKMGVNVMAAWDGNEAIAASRVQKFDLVFMDLQMVWHVWNRITVSGRPALK